MFWGLILRANKRYSQEVTKPFHVSQAVLDISQPTTEENVQVHVTSENQTYILCTLNKNGSPTQQMDLLFSEGDNIAFSCIGGVVHLTGYLIPNEDDFPEGLDDLSDLEDENENEVDAEESPAKNKQSGKKSALAKLAGPELDSDEEDSDFDENGVGEEDDDDDDDDDELGEEEAGSDDDDDDDDEELGEDDEEGTDDDDADEVVAPPPKKQKQQNGLAGKQNGKPIEQNAENKRKQNKKENQKAQPAAAPTAATPATTADKSQKEKVIQGGVKIQDIRVGKGPEASVGKKVQVYYEGRLKSNNKVFDSTKSGEGFQFKLGRGEVIRGWDIGVAGMKVGSKRRITCPPNMAYGAKGAPPTIPGNSTLVFEVELRGVK